MKTSKYTKMLVFCILITSIVFVSILSLNTTTKQLEYNAKEITPFEGHDINPNMIVPKKEVEEPEIQTNDYETLTANFHYLGNEANDYYYCGTSELLNATNGLYFDCSSGLTMVDDNIAITIPNTLVDEYKVNDIVSVCKTHVYDEPIEDYKCYDAVIIDYNATNTININSIVDTHFVDYQYKMRMEKK
jgi:hypothetical protein